MDVRDKLRGLILSHCKREGISQYRFCQDNGIDQGTLSGVLGKNKGISLELLSDWLSLIGYELDLKPSPGTEPLDIPSGEGNVS
jgi:hypothetical protein